MLEHQEAFSAYDGMQRNDVSPNRDYDYSNDQARGELDEAETSKRRQCLKKASKFMFSHIGLVGLVVVYAVAGGFLFELLEQHQDKLNCQEAEGEHKVQLTKLKQKLVAYIQYNTTSVSPSASPTLVPTLTYATDKDNQTVAYDKIASILSDYRDFIMDIGSKYRYYGDDCSLAKWTYPNALLFAITIMTTIGYGNITPVTWEGQICCICYATIGIPIFLLCLANISGVLGEMFRFMYARICCAPYNMIKRHRALARKAKLAEENGTNIDQVRGGDGWTMNGNNSDKSGKKRSDAMVGAADMDEETQLEDQRVTVPLTITMLIIAAYIGAGSMIFHTFEQWTMIQAGYFCFITLATIGFGDFVPGQDVGDPVYKLVLGAIYVLFGMAILAMCFDLMQEEIVAKFRWIGRKVGIIDKEEDLSVSQNNKTPNNNNESTRPSTATSVANASPPTNRNSKSIYDEDDNGWSTQRNSAGGRKLSPRNNIARVHPTGTDSNEGRLHQRAAATSKKN